VQENGLRESGEITPDRRLGAAIFSDRMKLECCVF
jgi:hypothetical protein